MNRALVIAAFSLVVACSEDTTRSQRVVDQVAAEVNPSELKLTLVYGEGIFAASSDTGCQIGVLKLGDGEEVDYWFHSHHRSRDLGCTRFGFDDGSVEYLHGLFCCEVMISAEYLSSRSSLERFIAKNDGVRP